MPGCCAGSGPSATAPTCSTGPSTSGSPRRGPASIVVAAVRAAPGRDPGAGRRLGPADRVARPPAAVPDPRASLGAQRRVPSASSWSPLVAVTAAPADRADQPRQPAARPALPNVSSHARRRSTTPVVDHRVAGIVTAPMVPQVPLGARRGAPGAAASATRRCSPWATGSCTWGPDTGRMQVWDAGKLGCPVGRGGAIRVPGPGHRVLRHCDWTTTLPREISPDPAAGDHGHVRAPGTWPIRLRSRATRSGARSATRCTTSGSAARSPPPSTP